MSLNQAEVMFNRILNIQWKINEEHRWSHLKLFLEHVRRIELWGRTLDWQHPPFLVADIPSRINPNVQSNSGYVEILENRLLKQRENHYPTVVEFKVCLFALKWSTLEDHNELKGFNLPAPFEPMLILYERGGVVTREHGWTDITFQGLRSIPRYIYENLEKPIVQLDKDILDAIDEEGKAKEKPGETKN